MFAVRGSIDAKEEWAIDFVDNMNLFLNNFGLNRDRTSLSQQAESLIVTVGSNDWYLTRTNEAEQLYNAGRAEVAAQKFEQILAGLDIHPSSQRCLTLDLLGRCLEARQWAAAEKAYRRSAELKESLGMITGSNGAVTTWNQLAIVNSLSGNAQEAESWYRKALERYKEPITYRS
jgi:tetratricopeptide (TPR) repeat protein